MRDLLEDLYSQTSQLQPEVLKKLNITCIAVGLPTHHFPDVELIARGLREYQKHHKPNALTHRQMHEHLKKVSQLANELYQKLNELDRLNQLVVFMNARSFSNIKLVTESGGFPADFINERHLIFSEECDEFSEINLEDNWRKIKSIAESAGKLADTISGWPSQGRKPTLGSYATFIEYLDELPPMFGKASRGGAFEKLSDTVFEAAEVPSKSEGAIKHYLETKRFLASQQVEEARR